MRRRDVLAAFGGTAAGWPGRAWSQSRERLPLIGVLFPLGEADPEQMQRRAALQDGLERLGYIDGRTARVAYRYAGGEQARFEALAKEIVALKPDVIFVQATGFAAALQREARTIPVVFTNVSDPLGAGFVRNLAQPGGNFTGFLLFESGIAAKWLTMLKEISPGLTRAWMIGDPSVTPLPYFFGPAEAVAASLRVELRQSSVRSAADIESAFPAFAASPGGGVLITPGSTMLRNRGLIIALAARHQVPVVFPERIYAVDGGLMSYGIADLVEPFRQAATYIDRILRGEKAAELPVQAPTKYTTVLNLRTAKALGVTVPASLLVTADEVIE
jgi:putative ABC transport system substrate-binding protein